MPSWDPDAIKQALDLELNPVQGEPDKEPRDIGRKKMLDNAALVVDSVVWLALYSDNEGTRLNASKYLIDRVYGRMTDVPLPDGETVEDNLTKLIKAAKVNRS